MTNEEFGQACKELHNLSSLDSMLLGGDNVGLRVTKHLPAESHMYHAGKNTEDPLVCSTMISENDCELELVEKDEQEFINRRNKAAKTVVVYDILLSPSYRVPVLYITASLSLGAVPRLSITEIYDAIVPMIARSALLAVGGLGALSMTVC